MSTPTLIGAVSYPIPVYNDSGWAQGSGNLTAQLIALANIATKTYLIGTKVSSLIAQSSAISSPGTGQWFDITNITLTSGTWAIFAQIGFSAGATGATTLVSGGVGNVTGNDSTGLILGDTELQQAIPITGANPYDTSVSILAAIVTVSGSAIYYLKSQIFFTAAAAKSYGRITAVQIG